MRIESIEIKNFRQYRDEKFVFPKKSGKKDIHIIIGENGEGKTNLLNALTWCLYGMELHLGDRNTAIRTINSQFVQELRTRGDNHGETSVIVEMSIEDGGTIRFMRNATYSITPKDVVETRQEVIAITDDINGNNYVSNSDAFDMLVSRYVPKEINEYIFFDGELMDQYFKAEMRSNIENGIRDLTKASTIERTIKALKAYRSEEIDPMLKRLGDKNVQGAQFACEEAEREVANLQQKIETLNLQINKAKGLLEECDKIIKGHDNLKKKNDELNHIEEESDRLKKKKEKIQQDLINFAREYYVYLALYPALKRYHDYIHKQESAGNLPPKIDKHLVEAILEKGECAICGNKLDSSHREHVEDILKKLNLSSITSHELSSASSALFSFFEKIKKYPVEKRKIKESYDDINLRIKENDEKYKSLFDELKAIPNQEEIKQAIIEKEGYQQQLDNNKEKLGREKFLLERKEEDLKTAKDILAKALQSNARMDIYRKQYEFCNKSISILSETIKEVLTECREAMRDATFEIFSNFMWKKDAFSAIEITEDYSFRLLDSFGEQTLGSCSAAERALLALSFTIALQQTSGHDSLLYIDTPLGRVGEKNRINFAQVLVDIAEKKQVILSFTPTEYDENVRAYLVNEFSSYCELQYENGVTTIKK